MTEVDESRTGTISIPFTPHPMAYLFDHRRAAAWVGHPPTTGTREEQRRVRQAERAAAKRAAKRGKHRGEFL